MVSIEEYKGVFYERHQSNLWGDYVKLSTDDLRKLKNYIEHLERTNEALKENAG